MAKCDNCGSFVTPAFKRVWSDSDGKLWACRNCGIKSHMGASIKENKPR